MKLSFYFFFIAAFCSTAYGQISIPTYKPVSAGKVDSCAVPTTSGLAAMPLFAAVTNGSWNLGSIGISPTPVTYTYKATTSGFPLGTFVDSISNDLGTSAANVGYSSWMAVRQTSGATQNLGEQILKRQAKSLGAVTTVAVDSIVFPQQVMTYSRALPVVKYPATIGSVWVDSAIRAVNFTLSVSAASLSNAPGVHKQIITSVDSVVGWGRMKIPIIGKTSSSWINVLQVHHYEIAVDSFFVNGSPASGTILSMMGLSQGQKVTTAKTNFLRTNSVRPLLEAVHNGGSHSSTTKLAYFNNIDIEEGLSVATQEFGTISVFPNPVSNGRINVSITGNISGDVNYTLTSITGQTVATGNMAATGAVISLPTSTAPGIYYLALVNQGGGKTVLAIDVQ